MARNSQLKQENIDIVNKDNEIQNENILGTIQHWSPLTSILCKIYSFITFNSLFGD